MQTINYMVYITASYPSLIRLDLYSYIYIHRGKTTQEAV